MKKILCITYRDWACNIYDMLQESLPNHNFNIVRNRDDYRESIITEYNPDIILWYGWSWKVPARITDRYMSLCLHPSALPKYRGGSPIQNQIIHNEKVSAVSIFKMNADVDGGDIIDQHPLSLLGNIPDIFTRMTDIGFTSTYNIITQCERNEPIKIYKQNEAHITKYNRRSPDESQLTINEIQTKSAEYMYNKIRMLTGPYPSAYIEDKYGNKIYITDAKL